MDDLDIAQERDRLILEAALDSRKPTVISKNGMCLWCHDEPVSGLSKAFCSTECGHDYEKWKRNQK